MRLQRFQRTLGNRAASHLLRSNNLRAKLTVGPANDEYEREADQVADTVMRMPEPASPDAGEPPVSEEEEPIQRASLQVRRLPAAPQPALA